MNEKIMEALHASDQAMTDCLEAQKIITELFSDLQELNHNMAEMLGGTEQYQCKSYYDDDLVLRDCTCGKCGKEKHEPTS